MADREYRPDIDGLRGIAVLFVILFHYRAPGFSGGFVGVDVFFVISGFLITGIIANGIAQGTFRFADFYVRRARRLFPALFTTAVLSFLTACVLFSPQHLERFGGALVHTLLGTSNFFFWSESDYFDADAVLKPLLHTWSLSVEVQFYLVWPGLLYLFLRKCHRAVPILIVPVVGLASLLLAERQLRSDEAAAFFLLPARVVEFAVGASLFWLDRHPQRHRFFLEPMVLAGLAAIALSVTWYDDEILFPGISAMLPCAGAALVIYGGRARVTGLLLRNPVSVWIGRISYSLYLVHWPLLVFYRYYKFEALTALESTLLIAIAVAVSSLMYRFIETPVRRGIRKERHLSAPAFGLVCVLLASAIAIPAAGAWRYNGWTWRLPEPIRAAITGVRQRREATWVYAKGPQSPAQQPFPKGMKNILIIGDSHAKDFFNAVYLNREQLKAKGLAFRLELLDDECLYLFAGKAPPTMRPVKQDQCVQWEKHLRVSPLLNSADYALMSTRWKKSSLPHLSAFHRFLKSRGVRLVLLGRTAEFDDIPTQVARFGRLAGLDRQVASTRKKNTDDLNRLLQQKAQRMGLKFKDKLPVLCSSDLRACDVLNDKNQLNFIDYGHWSLEGARYFGGKMVDMGFFDDLFE